MIDVLSSPKKNYDLLALEEIERIKEAGTRPSLLMHVCCGPCSCYPLTMLCPVFDLTLYYNNSNIYPREEFDRRLEELKKLIVDVKADYGFDVKLVEAPYDETYEAFLAQYANEKEGGPRCKLCYERRMGEAYDYAEAHNYDYFCTVKTKKKKKSSLILNAVGKQLEEKGHKTKYFYSDFKKRDGLLKGKAIREKYGLYNQDYCGCIFSFKERQAKKALSAKKSQ